MVAWQGGSSDVQERQSGREPITAALSDQVSNFCAGAACYVTLHVVAYLIVISAASVLLHSCLVITLSVFNH